MRSGFVALALAAWSGAAMATPPDLYGVGGRSMGAGGGGVAWVEDGSAARMNPAGLHRVRQPVAGVGYALAHERFLPVPPLYWDTNRDGSLDERDAPLEYDPGVDDASGFTLFAGKQVGGKFGIGLNLYLPTQRLIRFRTFEPSLPTWFMYENRTQRFVLTAGLGGEIVKGLSVGLSADMLAAARFDVLLTIDGALSGDASETEDANQLVGDIVVDVHELELDLVPVIIPIVGMQFDFGPWVPSLEGLVLGATWRKSSGLPIDVRVDMQANVEISDVGDLEPYILAAILDGNLNLYDHYVPSEFAFGAAWRSDDTLSAYVDVRRTDWAGMRMNIAQLGAIDLTAPLVDVDENFTDGNAHTPPVLFPTVSVRAGAEMRLPKRLTDRRWRYTRLAIRGGVGRVPTPLVSQGPNTAFLDTDRMFATLGAGLELWDPFALVDAPVYFDIFGQYNVLSSGLLVREPGDPAPGRPVDNRPIPLGGNIVVVGGQWTFDF